MRDSLHFLVRFYIMAHDNLNLSDRARRLPVAAFVWGWAGVIPFVALACAIVLADEQWKHYASNTLVSYSAVILTFMGGVHWGVVMVRTQTSTLLYFTGIVPSLFAVGSILLPSIFALPLLITGFITLLICDLWLVHAKILPKWYGHLRVQLTSAVVICLLVTVLHSRYM